MRQYEKFEIYHASNPHIYKLFVRYTMDAIKAGRTRLGAKMIIERIRWYSAVETTGDEFKINNNYAPYYARKFVEDFPQYEDFFQFRNCWAA